MDRCGRYDEQKGATPMNTKPVYLTAEGLDKLKAELTFLINTERPRVAQRIHDAKLDGDISENAEVIERVDGADKVHIGSKVVIKGVDGEETLTIVGSAEAAPREGRISNESPVGVALMGRKKGDKVTVHAPAGPVDFTVVSIS
jgi:transcription elongation factor GreA